MTLKTYIIKDSISPYDWEEIVKELKFAKHAIMKLGYPNGTDAEQCLIIYALYYS